MERLDFKNLFNNASDDVKRQVFYILTTYQSLLESQAGHPDTVHKDDPPQG